MGELAEVDGNVRAHFAFVAEPTGYRRPEWVQARGTEKDTLLTYTKRVTVPFPPLMAFMFVATAEPCRIRVNRVEVGVQGGFDPYPNLDRPRIQQYDILKPLREGENLIELEVTDLGASGYFLADALIESDGSRVVLMSDEAWQVTRNGRPTALAYYYRGLEGNENEQVTAGMIVGNSLLTARGIPCSGEGDLKNAIAMLIMDRLGAGGSFTELYAMDLREQFILMGHDGPMHLAVADQRPVLRKLKLYHGKRGFGVSVECKVKVGPVSILGVTQQGEGRLKFLMAGGESIPGPTFRNSELSGIPILKETKTTSEFMWFGEMPKGVDVVVESIKRFTAETPPAKSSSILSQSAQAGTQCAGAGERWDYVPRRAEA
jgi:hypothetical protein